MAKPKTTVLLDKRLHVELKKKIRNVTDISTIIDRLVEMYLNGQVKVVIPERQL